MSNIAYSNEKRNSEIALHEEIRALHDRLDEVMNLLQQDDTGEDEALLTRKQAAHRLSVSMRTLDTLEADGEIRAIRIRGRVLYHPDALDAFIRQCART